MAILFPYIISAGLLAAAMLDSIFRNQSCDGAFNCRTTLPDELDDFRLVNTI